jgi:ATP-dependent Lon protease
LRPSGYGERINPLQASFARANESATQAPDIFAFAQAEDHVMRDFRDAKTIAQTLRDELSAKCISITHSESLELVSRLFGLRDWNVLSARIQAERKAVVAESEPQQPVPEGTSLPTVPLRDLVLFPNMIVPLYLGRENSKRAADRAMAGDHRILVVTQRRAADDHPSPQSLYGVGVTARVLDQIKLDDGSEKLLVKGLERAAIVEMAEGLFLTAEIEPVDKTRNQETRALDLSRAVLEEFWLYRNASPSDRAYSGLPHIHDPSDLADAIAPFLVVTIAQRQGLLETSDVVVRLEKLLALMKTDRQVA